MYLGMFSRVNHSMTGARLTPKLPCTVTDHKCPSLVRGVENASVSEKYDKNAAVGQNSTFMALIGGEPPSLFDTGHLLYFKTFNAVNSTITAS
jgi:hypothetical protein